MVRCPFCSASLERGAVVCGAYNARRGFEMFGPMPDTPVRAWLKGLVLPAIVIVGSLGGFFVSPSPVWLATAGFALFVAMLAAPRLMAGSRWFHF